MKMIVLYNGFKTDSYNGFIREGTSQKLLERNEGNRTGQREILAAMGLHPDSSACYRDSSRARIPPRQPKIL